MAETSEVCIRDILVTAFNLGASDVHLCVNAYPAYRIDGELFREGSILTALDTEQFAQALMTPRQWRQYQETSDIDFAHTTDIGRLRINAYREQGHVGLALRLIPAKMPTVEQLKLPDAVLNMAKGTNGLLLVTGPTGSGKSTTLAALVNYLNEIRPCHIVTLEDPIEYVHQHKAAVVGQREVGWDTVDFARGLRACLRQDPDVIMVGEMRDLETIQTVITAAETGHLVLASMHTADAVETVHRIIDVYPAAQQNQIRIQLAATLKGVLAQRLLKLKTGSGRVAAMEVLVNTPAVANLIRTDSVHQIRSVMQTGSQYGMRTMEMQIQNMLEDGVIASSQSV